VNTRWWNQQEWFEVVERAPLVSIDLIVTNAQGEALLGWRHNKPAQHCWFVPGGVVRKGETLQQAFERIVQDELGVELNAGDKGDTGDTTGLRRDTLFGGVYQHHYTDNFAGVEGTGTHYVVLAHRLNAGQHLPGLGDVEALPKAQHGRYVWMPVSELLKHPQVHEYTKIYFQD